MNAARKFKYMRSNGNNIDNNLFLSLTFCESFTNVHPSFFEGIFSLLRETDEKRQEMWKGYRARAASIAPVHGAHLDR